jgi:hypothetical protein
MWHPSNLLSTIVFVFLTGAIHFVDPGQTLGSQPKQAGWETQQAQGQQSQSAPATKSDQNAGVVMMPSPQETPATAGAQSKSPEPGKPSGSEAQTGAQAGPTQPGRKPGTANEPEIDADQSTKRGPVTVYEGYVNVLMGEIRIQCDTLTYDGTTGDLVAEGNVVYDQQTKAGNSQRITARRAQINNLTHRAIFWETTGFTNRTETGEYLFYNADRVVKTGPDTYELYNATVTACEDTTPKWSFTAKRADLKLDDKVKLYNSVFRIHGIPALIFPIMWLPTTKEERKSGFLIPAPGNSNEKGRTLKESYFQTLGNSADLTLSAYYYSLRGLGVAGLFREQTGDDSYLRLSMYSVKDRLFGPPGPDQGGTSVNGYGVQRLPDGWLAIGQLSVVSSLTFRQIFSDDLSTITNPTQESLGYLNKNTGSYSINFMAENETTTLFRPSQTTTAQGDDFDVNIRHLPEADLGGYSRAIFPNLPLYLSFDSSVGAVSRTEADDGPTLTTTTQRFLSTSTIGRFDLAPRFTVELPSIAGIQITPSVTLRDTYYTGSLNPNGAVFDPDTSALPGDPRLNPKSSTFVPGLQLFNPATADRILPEGINRRYTELDVDVRPPSLEKDYTYKDENNNDVRRFRHVIEPYMTYRLISGIGADFNRIVLFDERDAVADTNEIEYGVINRFFIIKPVTRIVRRHRRQQQLWRASGMKTESPNEAMGGRGGGAQPQPSGNPSQSNGNPPSQGASVPPAGAQAQAQPPDQSQPPSGQPPAQNTQAPGQGANPAPNTLATGAQAELTADTLPPDIRTLYVNGRPSKYVKLSETNGDPSMTNQEDSDEPYEFLTIRVAQKYYMDPTFGGALVPGVKFPVEPGFGAPLVQGVLGQFFYPLNSLSGFQQPTVPTTFSPINMDVYFRPLSPLYTDVRLDLATNGPGTLRDMTVSGGILRDFFAVQAGWFYMKRVEIAPNVYELNTFNGNAVQVGFLVGNYRHGFYGGARLGYDLTHQYDTATLISNARLTNSKSFIGYNWDCCAVQFNFATVNVGLRNETQYSFTFYLAGLGNFGTDQLAQATSNKKRRSGNSGVFFDEWP